jgi:hypothetical protein
VILGGLAVLKSRRVFQIATRGRRYRRGQERFIRSAASYTPRLQDISLLIYRAILLLCLGFHCLELG